MKNDTLHLLYVPLYLSRIIALCYILHIFLVYLQIFVQKILVLPSAPPLLGPGLLSTQPIRSKIPINFAVLNVEPIDERRNIAPVAMPPLAGLSCLKT